MKRSWGQRAVIALNLVLIATCLATALLLNYGYGRAAAINRVALGRSLTPVPADAEPGERVLNILLVGSDSSAGLDEDDPIQIGRRGEKFGDVIIIAHLDERTGDIALLSLPRDLWVEIADTGREARINQALVTGGPATLIETIEDRFDIPIHHYVNVDFAGFQGLVAALGSVDIYFDSPARDWNLNARPVPRSQTGFIVEEAGCQSLDPEMALAYVRSRYYQTQDENGRWVTDPTADLGRIRRQQDFLRQVLAQAIEQGARNPFLMKDLVDTGLENVAIDQDLTANLIVDIARRYQSFEADALQTYSFPVVDGVRGTNRVLLPRQSDVEPILDLFGGAAADDPATVRVSLRSDTGAADSVAALETAGFEIDRNVRTAVDPGLRVIHGPDGHQAAEMVAAALDHPAEMVQRADLAGRTIVIEVGSAVVSQGGGADETVDVEQYPAAEVPMAYPDGGYRTDTNLGSADNEAESAPVMDAIEDGGSEGGSSDPSVGISACGES